MAVSICELVGWIRLSEAELGSLWLARRLGWRGEDRKIGRSDLLDANWCFDLGHVLVKEGRQQFDIDRLSYSARHDVCADASPHDGARWF